MATSDGRTTGRRPKKAAGGEGQGGANGSRSGAGPETTASKPTKAAASARKTPAKAATTVKAKGKPAKSTVRAAAAPKSTARKPAARKAAASKPKPRATAAPAATARKPTTRKPMSTEAPKATARRVRVAPEPAGAAPGGTRPEAGPEATPPTADRAVADTPSPAPVLRLAAPVSTAEGSAESGRSGRLLRLERTLIEDEWVSVVYEGTEMLVDAEAGVFVTGTRTRLRVALAERLRGIEGLRFSRAG